MKNVILLLVAAFISLLLSAQELPKPWEFGGSGTPYSEWTASEKEEYKQLVDRNTLTPEEQKVNLRRVSSTHLGYSASKLRKLFGEPDRINRTTNSYGKSEQWIYRKADVYLYLMNGVLTSYQD